MSIDVFIVYFIVSYLLAFAFTFFIQHIALARGIVDVPSIEKERKVHRHAIPLLGGIAVFLAFAMTIVLYRLMNSDISVNAIPMKYLISIFLGGLLLMIGGILDDRFRLQPSQQILFPVLASVLVIVGGIGIAYISNPFGGQIRFDVWQQILFWFQGIPYRLTLPADFFTFLWLMGMMYTTKFLDGLDGLVSGVSVIGALVIAALALDPLVHQNGTALLAIIVAGSFLGFLPWNWHPAKIFLGEGGSLFAGFMLGVLAIISGSKVTTTVLVVGISILDALWVILRRIIIERRSPFEGDRKHLHHRLLDFGFSHRSVVLMLYFFSAYFGVAALFLQSRGKLIAMIILSLTMLILGLGLVVGYWKRKKQVN